VKIKSIKQALRMLLLIAVYLPFLATIPVNRGVGPVPALSGRINSFTFDFLKQEAAYGGQNEVVSPMSIFCGLAMSYVASGGDTRSALARVAHYPGNNETLVHDLAGLQREITEGGCRRGVEMRMTDSVWLDVRYAEFSRQYLRDIGRLGAGSAHEVAFNEKEKASGEINAWVSKNTNGRITGSTQPGDFRSRSGPGVIDEPGLVSVNAVYFKAEWISRFAPNGTLKQKFYTTSGTEREVPMMHQTSLLLYSQNARFKFLEMPYRGGLYSMIVLLPREKTDPEGMLAALTAEAVVNLKSSALPHKVDVMFPKFLIAHHSDVKSILVGMGAGMAFDSSRADFGGMIVKKMEASRVYLSSVRHDAWMDVGEEGTEVAAVTTSVHFTVGCSAEGPPMAAEFHADHPFLFLIVHNRSRSVLFAGWIGNPADLVAG
jgi:serpin B